MSFVLGSKLSAVRISQCFGLLAASCVSFALFVAAKRAIDVDAMERFTYHARYAHSLIGVRIKSYNDLLDSTRSHLEALDEITAHRFHMFASELNLNKRYPAVDMLNFAFAVADRDRDAVLKKLRRELSAEMGQDVEIVVQPPGRRDAYLLTSYIEPMPGPRHNLYGVDLMRLAFPPGLLDEGRDAGIVISSGQPIAFLSRPDDTHLGLRTPIYRPGAPRATVAERRAAYVGSVGIMFSVPRLVRDVLAEIPLSGVRMTVVDCGPYYDDEIKLIPGRRRVLYDSIGPRAPVPSSGPGADVLTVTLPLEFNGRPWETTFSVDRAELYSETDRSYPVMVMLFGFIGSLMIYTIIHMLAASRGAALVLAREMTSELRDSQHKLQLSHQKLRKLADHAYQIKELERRRIAREIHDDLGQNLLVLRIETETLVNRTRGAHGKLHNRATSTLEQIDRTIKSMRQIINDLRPTVLDLGLSAAVEWQVNQFKRQSGVACELIDVHEDLAVTEHCATAFFRILQESLSNVQRHADATKVVVELRLVDGWLSLRVRDNGRGLPESSRGKPGSFGLVGIEERVLILGGRFEVYSAEGEGTTVLVSAPAQAEPTDLAPYHREVEAGSPVV